MFEDRNGLIDAVLGRKSEDISVRGGSLVNVPTGEIVESCDLA